MSRTHDYVSKRLSEVMDDIGVNERLVLKTRRAYMLMENIDKLSNYLNTLTTYYFGSKSEGSTTLGLNSDIDRLMNLNTYNAIQNMREWKPGLVNLLMIQNENISPGYCYLQYIRPDQPLPATVNDIYDNTREHCATDSAGTLLVKNTLVINRMLNIGPFNTKTQLNGPALTKLEEPRLPATDTVLSYYCESPPHQATSWLQKQRTCKWPTVWNDCRNVGCFVVPVGSKMSYEPKLEWRISTSLQERFLMFSLNITQLRCYILMKIILKTYMTPPVEDVLSSFMCKNVLFYCIANSSHDWDTGNLLSYLHLCLFMLKECVEQRNCPHLMIPDNNLLAGRMTDNQRGNLLDTINTLMKNDEQLLFEIQMDDLGRRLMMRLNVISYGPNFLPSLFIYQWLSSSLVYKIAYALSMSLNFVLVLTKHFSLELTLVYLLCTTTWLEIHRGEGDLYRRTASELLLPLVSSTVGSVIACTYIDSQTAISDQAFTYLEAGKESDALSGRLKLVSVLYCTGDMERVWRELRIIETQYNISELLTVCGCTIMTCKSPMPKLGYIYARDDYNETAIKSNLVKCICFLQCEINCVPHELRYEILRSYIEEDRQKISIQDKVWMDLIVVDSIPYLYFLHYKTYGHPQRRKEQQNALSNLERSITFESGLGHKETSLNLLGQCMEQENRQTEAFQCYIRSLKYRLRNNAARFLLCIQLFKIWKKDNTQ